MSSTVRNSFPLVALAVLGACGHRGSSMDSDAGNPADSTAGSDSAQPQPFVPWTFVSMPDFVNADIGDVSNLVTMVNSTNSDHETAIGAVFDQFVAAHPDFVLVAGDEVNGHWWDDYSHVQALGPVDTLPEKVAAVQLGARTYYGIWKQRFADRGLRVYPALGDHDIGDNDWGAGTAKASLVQTFRDAWANQFTRDAAGQPLYADRPVGTKYEGTAYAFKHKNMLIVSVDVFRQEDPATRIGPHGSVAIDVAPEELAWLDAVLTHADADPEITFVIVQGHTPVLSPFRQQNSSGMSMADGAASPFWQTLVNHKVDLYFAGEVHDLSANSDSGVEQVVHGGILGYAPNINYLIGTVYEDHIDLEFKRADLVYPTTTRLWQTGSNRPHDHYSISAHGFSSAGTLTVDKSSGTTVYQNPTGFFVPISQEQPPALSPGLAVHLAFDEAPGSALTSNGGTSGENNDGDVDAADFVPGKLGNAASFTNAAARIIAGPTPVYGSVARTTSAWVKLPASSTTIHTVFTMGNLAGGGEKWDFDIDETGKFEIGIANGRIDSSQAPAVTAGVWHNLTAVLPDGGTNLQAMQLYLDGSPIPFTAPATPVIGTNFDTKLIVGHSANSINFQEYSGLVDDLAIWTRALSPIEVRALVSFANLPDLAYDAGKVDLLLGAFSTQTSVSIGTTTWVYQAGGLTGPEGVVVTTDDHPYEINLGGGAGLVVPGGPSYWGATTSFSSWR